MAYSSGTFSRLFDWTDDRDNGIKIRADRFDQELDGFATGLSTALLKDGTQTATATIPFAAGISIIDNQKITLGTNSDITLQYDETTNDSLEIAANVEGAALGIVLKSDQGDDNADQHKLSIADGGTLTLGSKISGSFVTYLTHTPNATVADSTLAVAGNLTVGGNLTLGSGAVLSEAELEQLDGITAGTVTASKAVVVDANKDIASFRNITLTGELDAGSLDISGDADIDGTLEADAMTLNGSAITTTATLSTGISNGNVLVATSGIADDDFLRVNGTSIEGRSASEVLSDIGGQATLTFGISNTNAVKIDSASVADDEFARFTANGLESRSAAEVLSDIGASPVAGSSSIVTTGALDSGSITSGFGNIDTGSSTITTTGLGTFGTLAVNGATTITTADNNPQLTLISTDADGDRGPVLRLQRDSASPADNDILGRVQFTFDDDAGNETVAVQIEAQATDVSNGSEDGRLQFNVLDGGANREFMRMTGSEGIVINEEGEADLDFRVESNNNANMLFVDGADDRVGIGTATFGAASHKLEVDGGSGETRLRISSTGTDLREAGIILANSSKSNDNDGIVIAHGGASTTFDDLGGNELLRLSQSSNKMSFKLGANNEGFISNTNNNQTDVLMLLRDTSGSGGTAVRFRTGTSQVGTITINTNSTAYNTSSDYRLKENVSYDFDATTRLKQLKPARFNFISDDTNTLVDGFLAHEVSPIVPEAIYGSKDAVEVWKANEELPDGVSVGDNKLDGDGNTIPDYQGIDQSKLVPLLVKTIQELEARITALEGA